MIPADAELTARPDEISAWDDLPEDLKPVLARQMEVYAGFMEHTDHHVGRLVDALEDLGILDDTLVYVIIGDNGASAEGTPNGTFNEIISLNGAAQLETTEFMAAHIDEFGTPGGLQPLRGRLGARDGHAVPVDQAGRLALRRHPQRRRSCTGPTGFEARGEVRSQFHHVIDVAATVLDAAGLPGARRSSTASSRCRCTA